MKATKPEKKTSDLSAFWLCGFELIPSPLTIARLAQKALLFLTTLVDYTATRADLLTAAQELFGVVKSGG